MWEAVVSLDDPGVGAMRALRVEGALAAAAVVAALALGGCYTVIREVPPEEQSPPATTEATAVPLPPDKVETVVVPDVLGEYADAATTELEAAGLTATELSIHGPQDPDADEPGIVYRATPAAGTEVPKGTSVEIRTWWESQ